MPDSPDRKDDTAGRLRIQLRDAIKRNETAAVSTGAWDAIARLLDLIRGERPVVLIVEDDGATMAGYVRGLRDECDCLQAGDAETAITLIDLAPRLDLVILDLALPDASGYNVAAHLRATDRFRENPEILVISAYVTPAWKDLFSKLPGRTSWIEKVDRQKVDAIKNAVRRTPSRASIPAVKVPIENALEPDLKKR